MQQVTVRVPASTSNLGPGFDCLGVALRIYNDVTVAVSDDANTEPMIEEAATEFFAGSDQTRFPFSYSIRGAVPQSRGLGSSVTVRLGVLIGLNALAGEPLNREQLFSACADLEGHPDNAAPGMFGGFNVVRPNSRQTFAVSPKLRFVLLVPDFEVKTSAAREILPANLDRLDAVESCGNACSITAAFASKRYESARGAFADRLHQPFREKLIPILPKVIAAAEEAGAIGAWLSGSGSTIAAMTLRDAEAIGAAMLRAAHTEARVVITGADNRGARILPVRDHACVA